MMREGRGRRIVGWTVLVAICMTSLGCHFSVNYDLVQPAQPKGGAGKNEPIVLPPPSDGVTQTGFTPDRVRPGELVTMPARNDAAAPPVLGTQPAPDRPKSHEMTPADQATGLSPALFHQYADGPPGGFPPGDTDRVPTEKEKKTLPPYIVEPPDIMIINASRLVPRPPYIIQPLDALFIQSTATFPDQPINGQFIVSPDGTISLGFGYGTVKVTGMTLERARAAVLAQLETKLRNPQVSLGLAAFQAAAEVQGLHLVRQDGTISLGVYGCVYITGMSLCQAQTVIEQHLSQFFVDPEVSLDIFSYNSKAYYVIFDGGGYGQTVLKFPITGNETVLDAIYNAGGLPSVSSRRRMWVARPAPANHECLQILPVDWLAIVQGGATRTNYQLFPGDRIYVRADPLIQLDNTLAKIFSPIERVLGIVLLGTAVVNQIRNSNNNNRNNNNNNGSAFFVTGF